LNDIVVCIQNGHFNGDTAVQAVSGAGKIPGALLIFLFKSCFSKLYFSEGQGPSVSVQNLSSRFLTPELFFSFITPASTADT
jgi:hypothetical protein